MSIGIDFYDELELLATTRKMATIVFKKEEGRAVIQGKVATISETGQDAILRMDSGLEIRIADIMEVNGSAPSNLC